MVHRSVWCCSTLLTQATDPQSSRRNVLDVDADAVPIDDHYAVMVIGSVSIKM
jgi:hypothetical protein